MKGIKKQVKNVIFTGEGCTILRPLLFIILPFLSFPVLAQKTLKLIVVENGNRDAGSNYLTAYNFKDGIFSSKDTIFVNLPGPHHI